jgi:hypothetical protein
VLQLFSLVSMIAFSVVGATVGWRIWKIARRTGGAPERWIALCLLPICGFGYPLLVLAQAFSGKAALVAMSLGIAASDFGLGCIFFFTRAVFRPRVRWLGPALTSAVVLLLFHWGALTVRLLETRSPAIAFDFRLTLLVDFVSALGFGWAAIESLTYAAALRRRVALGLADPLVANRLLLWGLAGISTVVINFVNGLAAARGLNMLADPATLIVTGVLGIANALALGLAFAAPARYAAWVRSRSERAVAAAAA